jgi:hypothetical protein
LHRAGAGIYASGNVELSNCIISGNSATGSGLNGLGGGLYLEAGTILMRNIIFLGNHASDKGKGFYATEGSIVIQENVVIE